MKMKVLNLYAGIGGNRKLWPDEHEITAVELNPEIAAIYQDFFPNDTVIVGDAHQYLLDHFKEFDFIWSSPPCPTHSRMRMLWKGDGSNITGNKKSGESYKFPNMMLYEEIIFLQHFFNGRYCVENVISYYQPLIPPIESDNHYYWTNFYFKGAANGTRGIRNQDKSSIEKEWGFDLSGYDKPTRFKRNIINNCVDPKHGLHILNTAIGAIPPIQEGLFSNA